MNYQCIADNGIPPRDTRTRHLVPASECRNFSFSLSLSFLASNLIQRNRRCHLIKNE